MVSLHSIDWRMEEIPGLISPLNGEFYFASSTAKNRKKDNE
jgi:hypothetical protein